MKHGHNTYSDLLEFSFETERTFSEGDIDRSFFLAEEVFGFTLYDSHMSRVFADAAIDAAEAINKGDTREVREGPRHIVFLCMVNMPFFMERIDWGVSIRNPWWGHREEFSLRCTSLYNTDRKQILDIRFSRNEWVEFIEALISFHRK